MILHKKLSTEEMLECVAFAIYFRELKDFNGDIKCELNEDGTVEVYAVEKEEATKSNKQKIIH